MLTTVLRHTFLRKNLCKFGILFADYDFKLECMPERYKLYSILVVAGALQYISGIILSSAALPVMILGFWMSILYLCNFIIF
jgi:hypothetical protein